MLYTFVSCILLLQFCRYNFASEIWNLSSKSLFAAWLDRYQPCYIFDMWHLSGLIVCTRAFIEKGYMDGCFLEHTLSQKPHFIWAKKAKQTLIKYACKNIQQFAQKYIKWLIIVEIQFDTITSITKVQGSWKNALS